MTRTMYDGITPTAVPAGAAIYAGYVDGNWPSYQGLLARYPAALHVSVCVTASGTARVLDIENGDATPDQAPAWATRMRAAGWEHPVAYMNASTWPAVRQAFAAQGVPEPLYWVAAYVQDPGRPPAIPAGAIAIQYYDFGGYDASLVADHWPGLDPDPAPPTPPAPAPTLQEDLMLMLVVPLTAAADAQRAIYLLGNGRYVHVPDGETQSALQAAGVREAAVSYAFHAELLAAYGTAA